jgi:hypothetical protein
MDKMFLSTFDFFSYALPGCNILLALVLIDSRFKTAKDYLELASNVKLSTAIFIIVMGFVMGFAVSPFGRFLYKKIGFKLFPLKFKDFPGLSVSDKYTLIREYTPANFKYIETWNMWCTMSHNLAIAALLVFIISLARMVFYGEPFTAFWLGICLVSLLMFFFLLQRAVRFSIWAADDINSAINILKLNEKK